MKQPEALRLAETFKQPEMLYTHLLIENTTNNGYEPRIHLGCDEKSIVERAYDEGKTSNQIFTWHSDEKFKRLHEANHAMLEALKDLKLAVNSAITCGDWVVDGACDPDACLMRVESAITKAETNEGTA